MRIIDPLRRLRAFNIASQVNAAARTFFLISAPSFHKIGL